jgi:hypothetical protein
LEPRAGGIAEREARGSEAAAAQVPEEHKNSEPVDEQTSRELLAELPTQCAAGSSPCLPPGEFVAHLCKDKFPGLALVMLQKGSPWTRGYVRMVSVDPVNTLGGPATTEKLSFAEEVLLLEKHGGGAGGLQVSGSGGYTVLRWDGTCVNLAQDEVVTYMPAEPKNATIEWKYLDEPLQNALLENKAVSRAREAHRKECMGGVSVGATGPCARAVKSLNTAIVLALRTGLELPAPEKLPAWARAR